MKLQEVWKYAKKILLQCFFLVAFVSNLTFSTFYSNLQLAEQLFQKWNPLVNISDIMAKNP